MDNLKNIIGSYCFTFCKVIEFRITEAATRVHQIHCKATCKKREKPKKCPSFLLFSYFLFAMGNKSAVYICTWRAVREKMKTFREAGGCQFSYLWPCPWGCFCANCVLLAKFPHVSSCLLIVLDIFCH